MIDLHTHSTVSDGSEPPERIPDLAASAGCRAVALTDHDRVDGIATATARAVELGVDLVPGCEISCEWASGTMHVLVYFLDPSGGPLVDELRRLQAARDERNEAMAGRLAQLGLPVTYEEIVAEAGGKGAGRPHVAAILVRKGVVASIQEAFDLYLAKGRPGYVDKLRLDPGPAVELAKASGAVPVLAHPLSLDLAPAELGAAVAELAALGIEGLEAVYGRYSPHEREGLARLAKENDLVATGGSDFHGSYKPDLSVGTGLGDLDVPDTVLDALAARR